MTSQPLITDQILADLLAACAGVADRANDAVASALALDYTLTGWSRAVLALDEAALSLLDPASRAVLSASLAGAWRVGEALPAGNSEPTVTAPFATPPPATAELLRRTYEGLAPELRPLFLEALRPDQAVALGVIADDRAVEEVLRPATKGKPLPLAEEAVKHLLSRRLVRYEDVREMARESREKALVVVGVVKTAALAKLQGMLARSIEEGPDLREFRKSVEEELGDDTFLSPRALETTFRDAVQSSYSAGMDRLLDSPAVGDAFPYEETLPIEDSRLSKLCDVVSRSGIQGTVVYRRDDPTWRRLIPPRHPNCRCGRNPLTLSMAARKGIEEAREWKRTGKPPAAPAWVPMPAIAVKGGL